MFVCVFLGTKENLSIAKTLQEMWAPVESDLEKNSVSLLRWINFKESFLSSIVSLSGPICCLLPVCLALDAGRDSL